jgi:hypothetical protein
MKKAAVIGGVAWSVPVIQSAVAPASAASGGGPNLGEGCSSPGTACADGSFCSPNLFCGGVGAACPAGLCIDADCSSSTKICGGKNASCKNGQTCNPPLVCGNGSVCQ